MVIRYIMRTFHLPLPPELHDALKAEASASQRPATELVRQALESWLLARRKQRLAAELQAYAEAMAGTELDLDPELEQAGIAVILDETTS
jgi:predicted transcriptional regulator